MAAPPLPTSVAPRALRVDLTTARLAVVSTRPEPLATELRERAPDRRVVPLAPIGFGDRQDALDISLGDRPAILIADPDLWQSHWSLLGTLQRGCDILFDGCSLAELRALTRSRELPPPFPTGVRPMWIRTVDGTLVRAIFDES